MQYRCTAQFFELNRVDAGVPTSRGTLPDEKREQRRFVIDAPLIVRSGGRTLDDTARLRDLSIGGVFFYTSASVEPGLPIEILLEMSKEVGLPGKQKFCCRGTALRVHPTGPSQFGIAAEIHEYRPLSQRLD